MNTPWTLALAGLLCAATASAQNFVWPLSGTSTPDTINAAFGPRIKGSTGSYEFHEGLDLIAAAGTTVYAAADGTVRRLTDADGCFVTTANATGAPGCTRAFPGGGRIVQLDHGEGVFTLYFHLSEHQAGLDVNDAVHAGDPIGKVGQTGNATQPHLHFETRIGTPNRVDAENPLGELPWAGDVATSIVQITLPTLNGAMVVQAQLEADPDDLNLDRVAVEVRDASDQAVAQAVGTLVDFEDRINAGFDVSNPSNGITLQPAPFKSSSAVYRLTVQFAGLTLPSGGTFRITATDESGLSSQSAWVAIP
jgi:hypothetical protein